ncbi:hypothetical protein T484DRAFT_1820513 [Baffinella frigidus]|nr:hypothetical protein T484DRAFT_1820513 [Cryptophyta sp. CCMP2293]
MPASRSRRGDLGALINELRAATARQAAFGLGKQGPDHPALRLNTPRDLDGSRVWGAGVQRGGREGGQRGGWGGQGSRGGGGRPEWAAIMRDAGLLGSAHGSVLSRGEGVTARADGWEGGEEGGQALMEIDRGNAQLNMAKSIGDRADGLGVFLAPHLSENYDRVLLGVCYPSRREMAQLASWKLCEDCKTSLGADVTSLPSSETRCAKYQPRDGDSRE